MTELPVLPDTLSLSELRAIYREATPERAVAWGFVAMSPGGGLRYRKYAFARYWGVRLAAVAAPAAVAASDIEEWIALTGYAWISNVAYGVIGDAARANALTAAQVAALLAAGGNPYARSSLRARQLLLERRRVDAELVDALLHERGAWALMELAKTDLQPCERGALTDAVADARLSRSARHALRGALR